MGYAIIKSTPIPARATRWARSGGTTWNFPFNDLKVGHSFKVPADAPEAQLYGHTTRKTGQRPCTAAMYRWNLHMREKFGEKAPKLAYRSLDNGDIQIWRIE
jgi:hypothetical protein